MNLFKKKRNLTFFLIFVFNFLLTGNSIKAFAKSGNPPNNCDQARSECRTTPSKFSTTLYRVALCMTSPMEDPELTPNWDDAGCVDVYNNPSGESTGNIFDENGFFLSNKYIKDPPKNGYYFVAAIVDKSYQIGTHHMVYDPSTSQPINNLRYISTSSGNVSTGSAEETSMFETSTDSFYYGFDCGISGYNQANFRENQQGYWGNDNDLILLDGNYKLANTLAIDNLGKGKSALAKSVGQRICGDVKYILSITNKFTLINDESKGVHIKIKVPEGSILLMHATNNSNPNNNVPDGVIEEIYTGNTFNITFDIESF